MKKIKIIAVIGLMMIAATLQAQQITPNQLKEARMAVYEWVDDYIAKIPYEKAKRSEQQIEDFINLFESDSVLIYNDLYAMADYDFNDVYLPVSIYSLHAQNETSFFKYYAEVDKVEIVSESYVDQNLVYVLYFNKHLKAVERQNNTDNRYIYPEREISMECILKYDIESEGNKMLATSLKPIDEVMPFLVFYDGVESYYTTAEEIEEMNYTSSSPLLKTSLYHPIPSIDSKIVSIKRDTMKQNIHFSPFVGGSIYTLNMLNSDMNNVLVPSTLSVGLGVGYYHQYKLTDKHRLGIEVNVSYLHNALHFNGAYQTVYEAIDPDNGKYARRIEIDNYRESINIHSLSLSFVPIRHDVLFCTNNQHWSFYWNLGIFASCLVGQTTHAKAVAKYSGYYDWLFDVTMDQDGIYDFGMHQLNTSSGLTAIRKFNIGLLATLGFQYFIPRSHWSIEPSIRFQSSLYMPLAKETNFHIIDSHGMWNSATYLFNSMYMQIIGFQLNINYNFK